MLALAHRLLYWIQSVKVQKLILQVQNVGSFQNLKFTCFFIIRNIETCRNPRFVCSTDLEEGDWAEPLVG